jgi:hypothetical protein
MNEQIKRYTHITRQQEEWKYRNKRVMEKSKQTRNR